jgi:hypothetical protein
VTAKALVIMFQNAPAGDFKFVFQTEGFNWGAGEGERQMTYNWGSGRFNPFNGVTVGNNNKKFIVDIARILGSGDHAKFTAATAYANIILIYYGTGNQPISTLEPITAYLIPGQCSECGKSPCECLCPDCGKQPCECEPITPGGCPECGEDLGSCDCIPEDAIILSPFNWSLGDHATPNQQGWTNNDDRSVEDIVTAKTLVIMFQNAPAGDFKFVFQTEDFDWGAGEGEREMTYNWDLNRFNPLNGVTVGNNNRKFIIDIAGILGISDHAKFIAAEEYVNIIIIYYGSRSQAISTLGAITAFLIPADPTL